MTVREAINRAMLEAMAADPKKVLIGVGLTDKTAMWSTLAGVMDKYPDRVIEGPISENALTGMALGLATHGFKPMLIHHRVDFAMLSMDQLFNHVAKWEQMFGGRYQVPLVIRAAIGRGWGNSGQHTASYHALFAHQPGWHVVVPWDTYSAETMLTEAWNRPSPTVFLEHRRLYDLGRLHFEWQHPARVTVVAIGPMAWDAEEAQHLFNIDVIPLGYLRPLRYRDWGYIKHSLQDSGRLVVVDSDWPCAGMASEIITQVVEQGVPLKAPPVRVCWPDHIVPASEHLEQRFYPGASAILAACRKVCGLAETVEIQTPIQTKVSGGPF